jgi:hypothetical protein
MSEDVKTFAQVAASSSSSSTFTFALDKKSHFIKTKSREGNMPPKQIISKVLKAFPQITRAYTLADFVTFRTDDAKYVSDIQILADQLAATPPMATHRLFVSSIGGLPVEAFKSIFSHLGDVEEVALVSPLGNPAAIVVIHSDTPLDAICKSRLPYVLTAEGSEIERGLLVIQPAREKKSAKGHIIRKPLNVPPDPPAVSARAFVLCVAPQWTCLGLWARGTSVALHLSSRNPATFSATSLVYTRVFSTSKAPFSIPRLWMKTPASFLTSFKTPAMHLASVHQMSALLRTHPLLPLLKILFQRSRSHSMRMPPTQ